MLPRDTSNGGSSYDARTAIPLSYQRNMVNLNLLLQVNIPLALQRSQDSMACEKSEIMAYLSVFSRFQKGILAILQPTKQQFCTLPHHGVSRSS